MSGFPRIACRGAPRDLGLDQGVACAALIQALGARRRGGGLGWLAAVLRPAEELRASDRDTSRYFPHMAERAAGLARGASVSPRALATISTHAEGAPSDALRIVRGAKGPSVARALPLEASVVLRESAPDGGFRSIELVAAPALAPFVGVNEHGLAVGAVALEPPARGAPCAAPAALLAQDCLQRFDQVGTAVEWLERRPAGGRAVFALCDSRGNAAMLEVAGGGRRRLEPIDRPLTAPTAARCCVVVADPRVRELSWTFADGSSGDARLGESSLAPSSAE